MKIVIDVDGVLLNFNRGFIKFYNDRNEGENLVENPHGWNWEITETGKLNHLFKEIKAFIDTSPHLDIIDTRWPELIKKLREEHTIIIVTAYPNPENRIKTLSYYGIHYEMIYFPNHDEKSVQIMKLCPDMIIEDCPQHINKLAPVVDPHVKLMVPSCWNYKKEINQNLSNVFYYDDVEHLASIIG